MTRALTLAFLIYGAAGGQSTAAEAGLREINPPSNQNPNRIIAITGATLIRGTGEPAVADSAVVVRGGIIVSAGPANSASIPKGAEVFDGKGLFLVPGFIDSHFHIERDYELPRLYLRHGVTAMRDPGQWIEVYEPIRKSPLVQPRCFVAGPHLDQPPHAYPKDAFAVTNAQDTRQAVNHFVDQGASVIKAYFRLPLGLIKVTCDAAHARGVPVTAHLELVNADAAILAGLDGVEHVTSFGTCLAEPANAEHFRSAVAADNEARRKGRYELWSKLDLEHSARLKPVLDLIVRRKIFLSATLAVFERRRGDRGVSEMEAKGYENMLQFVRLCHKAGATIVVGSHSDVPKAERGWAFQRELELLADCGLTPQEVISAATLSNARYFRADQRLGSIQPGKAADLVLLKSDPLKNISATREIAKVMFNGEWVKE